jgi:hypothetical protein
VTYPRFLALLRLLGPLQFLHGVGNVTVIDNVIPLEHRASLPAPDPHDDVLADTDAPQVTGSGSPQIMEEQVRNTSVSTSETKWTKDEKSAKSCSLGCVWFTGKCLKVKRF